MSLILDGTNGLSDVDGTAAAPALRGTDTNTGIFFPAADTIAFAEGGAEVMRIDSSGNVGIGTTTPAYKLDVVGSVNVPADSSYVLGAGADRFIRYRSGNGDILYSSSSGNFYQQNITSGYHAWFTGNNERARIDSSGNLLVGQTALNGAGKVEIAYDRAGSWGMQIRNTTGTTQPTTYIAFKYGSTQTGYIESSGTNTTYNTSSDYRLKEDIAPMTGALEKVVALKPVTYKWKSTGMVDEGFIAHELAEVCPSAVTGTKDAVDAEGNPQYQGIDTSFLVATLTAAIQEQQALITALTTRITALEAA